MMTGWEAGYEMTEVMGLWAGGGEMPSSSKPIGFNCLLLPTKQKAAP